MRLVERPGQICTVIGQLETGAPAHVRGVGGKCGIACRRVGCHRYEMLIVELVRRLEQHAGAMRGFAVCRLRCPRCVLQREIEFGRMRCFVGLPARHVLREREFGEFAAE